MKRPNGNKTNAEWISEMCPYDLLVMMNNSIKWTGHCILECFEDNIHCKAGNCAECIRLWRLEPHRR